MIGVLLTGSSSEVQRTLGKILATQELILKQLEKHDENLEKHIEEDRQTLKRVEAIENKLSYFTGIALTAIAVLSFTSDFLLTKLGLK